MLAWLRRTLNLQWSCEYSNGGLGVGILVEWTKSVAVVSGRLGQQQIGILSEIAQYVMNATHAATFTEAILTCPM